MYQVKPIFSNEFIVELPKCMYPVKNIHRCSLSRLTEERGVPVGVASKEHPPDLTEKVKQFLKNNTDSTKAMTEIYANQQKILQQLDELKQQMKSIREELKATAVSKTQSPVVSPKITAKTFETIVVNANPHRPPFSLLLLRHLLADQLNLNVEIFKHSTVTAVGKETVKFEECVKNYQGKTGLPKLTLRLIWKDIGYHPELLVSSFPILGEVNILRYINRLLQFSSENLENCQSDNVLDTCYLLAGKCDTKTERSSLLVSLNKVLGRNDYFGGKTMNILDLGAYSALKSINSNEINGNLTKWLQRCEINSI